ncbi:EamA family transporter [Streptomyces zaomyceticus]|uniref:EamA family transporter n=1 Tax=Streptomyces zaomyceticus TaxID=68286 RepID=UPI0036880F40
MPSDLAVAMLAGVGAMVGWGFSDFFAKLAVDRIGSLSALVWAHLAGAAIIVTVVVARDLSTWTAPVWPDTPGLWYALAGLGAAQALVYLFVYRGFEKGRLAILNPLFSAYGGGAAILTIVFFGEDPSPGRLLAVAIVFGGVLLLSLEAGSTGADTVTGARSGGVPEILAATVLAAIWTVLWDATVSSRDWWTLVSLMYLAMAVTLTATARTLGGVFPARPRGRDLALVIGIGGAEVLAYLAISVGFSMTPYTSVVAVLAGAFSLPALALARAFLGDRLAGIHRLGAGAVITGTAVLAVVGGG